jgi:selenocysteine-specific elongation factor
MHVVATAGHVDHGKSTLVRALTGMEPDRWAEERRRGMTIDLGYAWMKLDDGTQIAFVDVPGHERFITNMLAGIGPVPAVLLVVAADEGWCRQTAEHLAALDALGVRHGVLAVTRSDLGDADLAIEEARDYLAQSSLADIEAVAVSPVKGTGIDELRAALLRMTAELDEPTSAATRLWVDRVFSIQGAGTVVTGTLASGRIAIDDELTVSSTGETVRVRSLESLKTSITSASAVARVAVNLRGVKRSKIRRGDALITAGQWAEVRSVDVRLVNVSTTRLPAQPILHIGSAAVRTRLRALGPDTARLSIDTPLPLHIGERALLRDPGRQHVVAGVIVLDTDPPRLVRRGAAARRAAEIEAVSGRADPAGEVRRRRAVRFDQLVAAGVVGHGDPAPANAVIAGRWLIDAAQWAQWQQDLQNAVEDWAKARPLTPGMPRTAAAQRLGLPDPAILESLVRQLSDLVSDGDGVHRRDVATTFPPQIAAAIDALTTHLTDQPFAAADGPELAAAGLTERYLAAATKTGRLINIAPGIYLLPTAPDEALRRLADLPQPFTLSEARQALHTTRRVAVPLLELLDQQHSTIRVDSQHRTIRT